LSRQKPLQSVGLSVRFYNPPKRIVKSSTTTHAKRSNKKTRSLFTFSQYVALHFEKKWYFDNLCVIQWYKQYLIHQELISISSIFMSNKILNSIQNSTIFVGNAAAIKLDNIIDSRSLQNGLQTFFCIGRTHNDAHAYIKELIAVGVQNFVVTHIPEDVKEMLISLLSKILRVLYKNLQPIIAAFNFLSSG
jgi:hypothetical protein